MPSFTGEELRHGGARGTLGKRGVSWKDGDFAKDSRAQSVA